MPICSLLLLNIIDIQQLPIVARAAFVLTSKDWKGVEDICLKITGRV